VTPVVSWARRALNDTIQLVLWLDDADYRKDERYGF
jgi:hypothetical protein